MAKFDPYNPKEKYENWREEIHSRISGSSEINSNLILDYLDDMEQGVNIAKGTKKGTRSYIRLNVLRQRMFFMAKEFEVRFNCNLTNINEEQLFDFFQGMRSGKITREDGKKF